MAELHNLPYCYDYVTADLVVHRQRIREKRAECRDPECQACLEAALELGLIIQALQALDHFRP